MRLMLSMEDASPSLPPTDSRGTLCVSRVLSVVPATPEPRLRGSKAITSMGTDGAGEYSTRDTAVIERAVAARFRSSNRLASAPT